MLIRCGSCDKEISEFAELCPSCGCPNSWIHQKISDFLEVKDKTGVSMPFTFEYSKTELWGQTKPALALSVRIVFSLILLLAISFGILYSFWVAIIGGAIAGGCVGLLEKHGKRETFRANFQTKKWESSNENLWAPLRKILDL